MKKVFIIIVLLFVGLNGFGQSDKEIVGTWIKDTYNKVGMTFTNDGEFRPFEVGNEHSTSYSNKSFYKVITEGNSNYIIIYILRGNEEIQMDRMKFKIEDNKLYLPTTWTENGVTTVNDFKDVYSRKVEE